MAKENDWNAKATHHSFLSYLSTTKTTTFEPWRRCRPVVDSNFSYGNEEECGEVESKMCEKTTGWQKELTNLSPPSIIVTKTIHFTHWQSSSAFIDSLWVATTPAATNQRKDSESKMCEKTTGRQK